VLAERLLDFRIVFQALDLTVHDLQRLHFQSMRIAQAGNEEIACCV
jgi:hypothetical protein